MSPSTERVAVGRIGRDTAIYAGGILLNRAVAFIMLPIYSRQLSPDDYGVIQLVEMTLDFVAILAGAKLALGVFRYYHSAKTDEERNAVASTSVLLICGAYAVVSLFVLGFATPLAKVVFNAPLHADLLRVAALGLAAQSLSVVPLAHARARSRPDVFVAANLALLLLQISLNILLLVYLKLGPIAVFISNALASTIVGGMLTIHLIRGVGLHFSTPAARRLVRYGLPLVATQIATFIATFGDRYVLERHANMTTVGLYALAYQFGFLLFMVGSMPVDLVWEPIRFRLAEQPDKDRVLSRAFVYLNVLLLSAALGITLFVGDVLRLMTTPAFYPAATLVPVILIAYIFQSWTGMQDVGIHLRERTELITLANWIAAGVAAAGYFLFIPRWLGLGAAVATVLAFAVRYLVVSRVSQRLFPVRYQWSPVARILCLAIATAALSMAIPPVNLATSFALRGVLFAAYVAALWRANVLTDDERAIVRRLIATRLPVRERVAGAN